MKMKRIFSLILALVLLASYIPLSVSATGISVQDETDTEVESTAVVITQQPVSVTVMNGETATVTFTAEGDDLTYTWYYMNAWETAFTKTASFTGNTYSVQMNDSRDGRQLYCVVADKNGNVAQTETVSINKEKPQVALAITQQPESVTAAYGQDATVTFTAEGEGLTYKWYYKNSWENKFTLTTTFTGNTYTAQMNPTRNGRQIYCVVTDRFGSTLQTQTVTLNMATPATKATITKQPASVTVAYGKTATVSFTAEGEELTYQWYYKNSWENKFTLTTSFTGNTYTATMDPTRNGRQLYCLVTDRYGQTAKTQTVTIKMATPATKATIVKEPASVIVPYGQTATVSFTATGEGLTYKWYYKNSWEDKFTLTTSFTGNTYTAQMDESRDGRQLYCQVTDQYGQTAKTKTVSINMSSNSENKVTITKQPTSVTAIEGQTATVSFTATGEDLTYQWYYKNSWENKFTLTASFTTNTYTAQMNQTRSGRQLYCVVTDKHGNTAKTETVIIKMASGTYTHSGTCGENVTWGLTQAGTLVITGNGPMRHYWENEASPWKQQGLKVVKVEIKSGVTRVGARAFEGCTSLTSVSIPEGVTEISFYGFSGCTKLAEITIPGSVLTVGDDAFSGCTALKYNVHGSAKYLGSSENPYHILMGATATTITSCTVHADTKLIGDDAFAFCTALSAVSIPEGVVAIGDAAFAYCTGLSTVSVPSSVKTIGEAAFYHCNKLVSVTVPEGLTSVGGDAFAECASLNYSLFGNALYLGSGENRYSVLVKAASADITGCAIHPKTKLICGSAFYGCEKLTSVSIPKSVTAIGADAFSGCAKLAHIYYNGNKTQAESILLADSGVQAAAWHHNCKFASVTKQPAAVSLEKGKSGAISVTATGDGLTYNWYYKNAWETKFTKTASITGNSYAIPEMTESRNGRQVYCVITDQYGNSVQTETVKMTMK